MTPFDERPLALLPYRVHVVWYRMKDFWTVLDGLRAQGLRQGVDYELVGPYIHFATLHNATKAWMQFGDMDIWFCGEDGE